MNSTARGALRALVLAVGAVVAVGLGPVGPAPVHAAEGGSEPRVVVESAELVEVSTLGTWFGGAARPMLELVLYNNAQSALVPVLELEWRDGNALPNAVPVPELEEIPPGTRVTVEVPVQFDGLAQGEHSVSGVVRAGAREDTVEATTRVVPWGLYGLLVVAVLAGSALRTRWVMTQLDRDEDEGPGEDLSGVGAGHAPPEAGVAARAPSPEVEAAALATIERFSQVREEQSRTGAVAAEDDRADAGGPPAVPTQRAPSGGRRAARSHKASTPWLTRR